MPMIMVMNKFVFAILLWFSMCYYSLSIAQNLVPNAGFEEQHNGLVTEWVQPQGMYYHYTTLLYLKDDVPTKLSFNGLHIGNTRVGTEYMYVKLKQPLTRGVVYCAKMKVKMPSLNKTEANIIQSLGWKWITNLPDISARTYFTDSPDVIFTINHTPEIYAQFVEVEASYTAVGGEHTLMIGKYFSESDRNNEDVAAEVYQLNKSYDEAKRYYSDSFAVIYPPIPDYISITSKRKLNKLMRVYNQQSSYLLGQHQHIKDSLYLVYQKRIDSLTRVARMNAKNVDIMTYFDDFCLAPIKFDGSCGCEDVDVEPTSAFVKGETYRLNGVNFETDKYDLNDVAAAELGVLLAILIKNPSYKVIISGHTDNRADAKHNQVLSEQRSRACANYLIAKGIHPSRIKSLGYGAEQPLAPNDTEEGRAINRRVEFVLE